MSDLCLFLSIFFFPISNQGYRYDYKLKKLRKQKCLKVARVSNAAAHYLQKIFIKISPITDIRIQETMNKSDVYVDKYTLSFEAIKIVHYNIYYCSITTTTLKYTKLQYTFFF